MKGAGTYPDKRRAGFLERMKQITLFDEEELTGVDENALPAPYQPKGE